MLTGFVLVPVLGLVCTLAILAVAAAAVGFVAVMLGPPVRQTARWTTLAIDGAAMVAAVRSSRSEFGRALKISGTGSRSRATKRAAPALLRTTFQPRSTTRAIEQMVRVAEVTDDA